MSTFSPVWEVVADDAEAVDAGVGGQDAVAALPFDLALGLLLRRGFRLVEPIASGSEEALEDFVKDVEDGGVGLQRWCWGWHGGGGGNAVRGAAWGRAEVTSVRCLVVGGSESGWDREGGVLLLQGVAAWQVRAEGAWREVTAADWGGRNALDEAPIGVGVVPRAVW